ncbi:MAG TPA: pseudouridine synthase [Nitrospiraceae bacterium]|nr:MAG: pseudouridine synthase [Nitrospirae bacterium GWA2_46_11]OGW25551.1 MAG: pseudouridine synthase [Nitrospirae bacterium GWB2_47_37]HAK89093.1 pseudouridine synthase [Nitrospiraceae bacterium]HCZ12654.1 pseudouridine synthase [Nitrospiraceae bacterium]
MEQRIQKILAMAGIASRRKAEEFIIEGRVTVNGKTAVLGAKADPSKDHIKVDGKLITRSEPKVYLMFNKPAGVVTSLSDPEGRPTVKDFLKGIKYRVFPVGRLDYDSEGLLLMTNDGDLAYSLLHPSKKIPKIYLVKAQGIIDEAVMESLRRGVRLEDGLTAPAKVKRVRQTGNNTWVEITIYEGRKRQIRRMLEKVGHSVIKLRRISISGLKLGDLKQGEMRRLTIEEIKNLIGKQIN